MNIGQWIGLIVLLISLYVLWQIRQLLLLVFTAIVIATALNRLARRLQKLGISRGFAILLSVGILLTILAGFFWLIVPAFSGQFQQLAELFPKGLARSEFWAAQLEKYVPPQFTPYLPDVDGLVRQIQPLANQLFQRFFTFFSSSFGFVVDFLLVLILTLMFISDPQPYRKAFICLFPSFYRRRVNTILDRCEKALRGWLIGILFNMFVIASLSGIGLFILGIPLPLAQAALAGILTFIPNVGPVLSVIPPMAIALLDAPWKSLAVLGLYVGIQQLETNFLTPVVMAQQVSLLPAVTLLSQVFFATFFGFLGLVLALPLTVVAQVWIQEVLITDVLDKWGKDDEEDSQLQTSPSNIETIEPPQTQVQKTIVAFKTAPPPEKGNEDKT